MERGEEFNELMKNAFDGAEATPSENVWTNIELELEKAEGNAVRRRLFFYKMVAAASLIFALTAGATTFYFIQTPTYLADQQLSVEKQSVNTVESQAASALNKSESNDVGNAVKRSDAVEKAETQLSELGGQSTSATTSRAHEFHSSIKVVTQHSTVPNQTATQHYIPSRSVVNNNMLHQDDIIQLHTVGKFTGPMKPATFIKTEKESVPDAGELLLAKLAQQEQAMRDEEKKEDENKNKERLWTSIGFSAGGYSGPTPSVSPSTSASIAFTNSSVANQQAKASGSTYSVGLQVGTKLAKRWVLLGGFNYITQGCEYTSNSVMSTPGYQSFKTSSLNDVVSPEISAINISTASYQVTNTLQYISVPVQAGYLLVNRKLGVQLNTGLSTDLFLQNTLTPQSGNLDKVKQESGSNSPYRAVNFSGLVGTEISYRISHHYRFSLNPGLRYPINSIYKSDLGIQSTPLTFDVALRFRYIFQ